MGRALGEGSFGRAREVTCRRTGRAYACKTVPKRALRCAEDVEDLRREVQVLSHLSGHPHVVRLHETLEDADAVHLVVELCTGGDLLGRVLESGRHTERGAAALGRTVVAAVAHMHQMGVMHRDLKPENFLLSRAGEGAELKCTDFGLSVFFKPGERFHDTVGSAFFIAPEVLGPWPGAGAPP